MNSATGERLGSLCETLGELFPHGTVEVQDLAPGQDGWRLVPSRTNPRLAVPANVPAAAMRSAIRPCASDGLKHKARRYALAAALRSPAGARLMPAGITVGDASDSITTHLENIFNQPVCFGLMTGSARANRKPVLGIFDRRGRELGFAKIGLSELAHELVANEHRALLALQSSSASALQVPQVISYDFFDSKPVLVMSALRPNALQRPLPLPVGAVIGLLGSAPVEQRLLADSTWFRVLLRDLEALAAVPEAGRLADMVRQLPRLLPEERLAFGAWHGDFGPWNMARTKSAPMVWDWERYDTGQPVGNDLFHFAAHERLREMGNMGAALRALRDPELNANVAGLQVQCGTRAPRHAIQAMLRLLYLATLAARFLGDGHRHQVEATFALGRWYTDVMQELIKDTRWG